MTSLPRFSVNNPVLVNLFMLTIIGGGVFSGLTLVREFFPESRPNRVLITTVYPGAAPAEVEKGITLKIEEQIKDVDGVEETTSIISEGISTIVAEMRSGFDAIDQAVTDIKAAIDAIPREDFPEDALETRVAKLDPTLPVTTVSLYGDLDDRTLKELGERLRDDVLALPDVTDVFLSGTRKDEISVEVRPEKLAEYGLSFMQVAEAIAVSNLDLPGGQIRTARANVAVRTLGEEDRGEDLYDISIRSDPTGRTVRLRDVATVIDGFEDVDIIGRFQASPAVSVIVSKTADQDAIAIAEQVRAMVAGKKQEPLRRSRLDQLSGKLSGGDRIQEIYDQARTDPFPPGVKLKVHRELSRFIEQRLDLLKRNGVWGLALVFLSLLVFLHWRVALWVMMGLVLAIMGALICMKLTGMTLNLITMFGLIMILGLLVDDAIIVSEHVYTKIEQGTEPKRAAVLGTEEVTWPVVCAIVTTIIAFVPLAAIEGQLGDWLGVLPLIACVALSASLLEALTILPSHLAHGVRPVAREDHSTTARTGLLQVWLGRLRQAQQHYVQSRLRAFYERLLRTATSYRYVTMAVLTAVLLVAVGAYKGGHVPFIFIQRMDSETVFAKLKMSIGAPISATREAARVAEEAALSLPETQSLFTLIGMQVDEEGIISARQAHTAQLFLELTAAEDRERSSDEIVQELRRMTSDIPGVEEFKFTAAQGGPGGAELQLEISGERIEDLVAISALIRKKLASFDGVEDIVDNFDSGQPEVQIELLESARALGLTTKSLATQVRSAFYGFEARKVQRGREDVKIMVRYPAEYRRRIYDIESMRVATPTGCLVPFTEVARLKEGTGYATISRKNQRRTITVTADVDSEGTNTTAELVMAELSNDFPQLQREYPGIELTFGGQKLETKKSFESLERTFPIALGLIYVVLAGLFRSYVQPIIVMSVIPFGLIGVVAGHYVMGYPLTIMSMFGAVALTGIIVNDSMILVAFANRRIASGVPMFEAVIEAGRDRLRPILLTSATTVLGLAPLVLERSFQAKFLVPMGISVSAGLIFATVLTLLAVPALYMIVRDMKSALTRFLTWVLGRPKASESASWT